MIDNKSIIDITGCAAKSLVFVGDIHGNFDKALKNIQILRDTIQVYCGDIGMGFYKPEYYKSMMKILQTHASECNVTVVLIRGNHDKPSYFTNTEPEFDANDYPDIWFAGEWQIFKTKFGNILCQGGGVSVDRYYRKENVNWWSDERITYADYDEIMKKFPEDIKIDIIATHTAPASFKPSFNKARRMLWNYPDIIAACDEERKYLDEFMKYLERIGKLPKYWFYGHFHDSYITELDNITGYGLNINETEEIV